MRDRLRVACLHTPCAERVAHRRRQFALIGGVASLVLFFLGPVFVLITWDPARLGVSTLWAMAAAVDMLASLLSGVACGLVFHAMLPLDDLQVARLVRHAGGVGALHCVVESWRRAGYTLRYRESWLVADAVEFRQRATAPLPTAARVAAIFINPGAKT